MGTLETLARMLSDVANSAKEAKKSGDTNVYKETESYYFKVEEALKNSLGIKKKERNDKST